MCETVEEFYSLFYLRESQASEDFFIYWAWLVGGASYEANCPILLSIDI